MELEKHMYYQCQETIFIRKVVGGHSKENKGLKLCFIVHDTIKSQTLMPTRTEEKSKTKFIGEDVLRTEFLPGAPLDCEKVTETWDPKHLPTAPERQQ